MKKSEFWNVYPEFLTKKLNQNNQQGLFVLKNKIKDTILKNSDNFGKIGEKLGKKFWKLWIKQREFTLLFSEV